MNFFFPRWVLQESDFFSGLVECHFSDGAGPFTEEQLLRVLPDRDMFVERKRHSESIEPWYEDTHLPFDVVADWVSRSFKAADGHWDQPQMIPRASNDSRGQETTSFSSFALDFYAKQDIVVSSDSEPGAAEIAHWSSVYEEVRGWNFFQHFK